MVVLFGAAGPEVLILIVLVVILFFTDRLTDAARTTGESIGNFAEGVQDGKDEFKELSQTDDQTDGEINIQEDIDPEQQPDHIASDSVFVVDGVGETYGGRLESEGVETVYELANTPPSDIASIADVSEEQATTWVNDATNRSSEADVTET